MFVRTEFRGARRVSGTALHVRWVGTSRERHCLRQDATFRLTTPRDRYFFPRESTGFVLPSSGMWILWPYENGKFLVQKTHRINILRLGCTCTMTDFFLPGFLVRKTHRINILGLGCTCTIIEKKNCLRIPQNFFLESCKFACKDISF